MHHIMNELAIFICGTLLASAVYVVLAWVALTWAMNKKGE